MQQIEYRGNYINGEFIKSNENMWSKISPSDLKDHVFDCYVQSDHVDYAVEAARSAFLFWKKTSLDERKNLLLKLKKVYQDNSDKIAECIARETGKALWESLSEAKALVGKIDITINESLDLVSEKKIENAAAASDGYIRYKPKGVLAIIGPFNFPAHLPNGHYVPALLTGNTVVYKPSEQTPATGQLIAELIHEAGFPPGVFNLVQGKVETSKKLVRHEHVNGVLFTGSYETGLRIKQDIVGHYWKSLALEMGGKNPSIVWNDANMDQAIYDCLFGSYASAGQRCSCTSRIILHKDIKEEFIERFHNSAKKIKIGHWSKDVFYGALISEESVDRYLRFQEIALREGAESIMRGKALDLEPEGYYVSPSIYDVKTVKKDSVFQQEEIFGPSLAIYTVKELEEAFDIANNTTYGLAASMFTKDRSKYLKAVEELDAGLINWNKPTCGASSKLPFGGEKKSGNGWPSGHFAIYYCTSPVASLEEEASWDPSKMATGIELV